MVSVNDVADRPARAMSDGETLVLGKHSVKWLDTPHLPHGWETGYLMEVETATMFCGDLFTQGGSGAEALIDKLALENPTTLACMHGSAWTGNGADLLRALGERLMK